MPQGKNRRDAIAAAFKSVGLCALSAAELDAQTQMNRNAPIPPKDNLKITKLETFLVKPRWLFLKIHTNAGITGLGAPIGIDQALWDIKGKALGVPVYELLGGPTRDRVRVYAHASKSDQMQQLKAQGFTAFKTGVAKKRPARYIETQAEVQYAAETFASLREAMGKDIDIAIDFHGAISPATAKLLIKAYEPYQPMFIEEPCQAQNHDIMAEIARGTFLPIATGERVFTKWGFREVLEKKAATVLQPDLCHAGGITEVRLIAGMAEAYYADIAPHNPLGPISLAAGVQMSASIPNFLCQEQVSLGEGYLKHPFRVRDGFLQLPPGPGVGI